MPFIFAIFGVLFLIVAVRGTQGEMFTLLKSEFTGKNSFIPWASSILILGFIGYAKPVRPITDALIGLILLVIILNDKGGFFKQLTDQINNPKAPAAQTAPTTGTGTAAPFTPGAPTSTPTPSVPGSIDVPFWMPAA